MRRPTGWTEERTCPWCQTDFIASQKSRPRNRYCSHRCANEAKSIVCDHYAEMGRKGRESQAATQDARWLAKIANLSPLEAYKQGRRDGYGMRVNFEAGRKRRAARLRSAA